MIQLVYTLIGVIIGGVLTALFSYLRETKHYRRELALKVVEWADDLYNRVSSFHVHRTNVFLNKVPLYSDSEYVLVSRELNRILTSSKMTAMVNIAYGDGEETKMMNTLQGELLGVYRIIIRSSQSTWEENDRTIREIMGKVETLRVAINNRFIPGVKVSVITCDLIKYLIPTFWNFGLFLKRQLKKLVAIFLAVLFCNFSTVVHAQNLEKYFSAVAYLQQQTVKTTKKEGKVYEIWLKAKDDEKPFFIKTQGTGFFVYKKPNMFLITAEHVARKMTKTATVTIRGEGDSPITFTLQQLLGKNVSADWFAHDKADVAVLRLNPEKKILKNLERHFLRFDTLRNKEQAPKREFIIKVIGFPLSLGIKGKFSPSSIEYKTMSGLLSLPRLDNKKEAIFFMLDKPSAKGVSGAPVFEAGGIFTKDDQLAFRSGPMKCIGLIHGTLGDTTGGKFTAVTPSNYILETIEKYEESIK